MKIKLLIAFSIVIAILIVGCPVLKAEVYIWQGQDGIRHISNVRPDWWTDDMDQMEPGTVTAPAESEDGKGKFIGDRENKKFHWPKCEQIYNQKGLLAIPEHKQIWFKEYQDAVDQGYHVCDHCKPSADGPAYEPQNR